jgi:thioredoxin reductase/NAD-dependent dihydropyrimidine dehydrogenase PreA subunit
MDLGFQLLIYAIPLALIWAFYVAMGRRRERRALTAREEVHKAGLHEPPSLHPVIDVTKCVGCGACVAACPENSHHVLGLIEGRSTLVSPSHCIGHGACRAACPVGAITLVFGTEKRGVDIPHVKPNFETNVPGIFIAGELGGMGLIRNAVEQGRQALESIRKLDGIGKGGDLLDVVIVGAGPAGIAATLGAMQHGLRSVTLEQDSLGGTVAHFPRGKIVMTAPAHLPIVGKVKFTETTKEKLLAFWMQVVQKTGLKLNLSERVENVTALGKGFEVKTTKAVYKTRAVLLAIGRRGTPRTLGVPGEERSKVVYRLIDAEQYRGQHVLVVGGGDSALEAALSCADESGTTVTLSYRSEAFSRVKDKNRQRLDEAQKSGRIRVMLGSNVKRIDKESVVIEQNGKEEFLPNDAVIVCAGGILPTPFLKQIGIEVETKYGTA